MGELEKDPTSLLERDERSEEEREGTRLGGVIGSTVYSELCGETMTCARPNLNRQLDFKLRIEREDRYEWIGLNFVSCGHPSTYT